MQTFLYVLGPFILQLGGSLGFLAVGLAGAHAIVKRTLVAAELKQAQRDKIETLRSWASDADAFIDSLVIEVASKPSLSQDVMSSQLLDTMYELNAVSPQKQLERAKPRRRAVTER